MRFCSVYYFFSICKSKNFRLDGVKKIFFILDEMIGHYCYLVILKRFLCI